MTKNKKLLHRIEKLEEYAKQQLDFHERHININLAVILLMAQKQGVDLEQLFDDAKQVQAIAKNLVEEIDE